MSFFHEYSLLFAIAIPVAVIVLIELALWMSGERGASLLPGLSRYPMVMSEAQVAAQLGAAQALLVMPKPELPAFLAEAPAVVAKVSANDKAVREAA